MVTDPYLVSEVLSKATEIEKSIEGVYSKFNIVSLHAQALWQQQAHLYVSFALPSYRRSLHECRTVRALSASGYFPYQIIC